MQAIENIRTGAGHYRVVPLSAEHADDAGMLERVLQGQPNVTRDPRRDGFYWVDVDRNRFYVNVHDATETIYLVTIEGERLVRSEATT